MAARHGQNTANGIISIIVLVFGVIISSVASALLRKFIRNDEGDVSNIVDTTSHRSVFPYATSPIWTLGLFYVFPGLIGFISAFVKQKGVYIAHMVFSIISLVVMGMFFLVGQLAILRLATTDISECVPVGSKCQCSNSGPVSMTCDDMRSIYTMTIVLALVFVVAWILSLVGTILSGMLGCRREPVGIIIQRSPMTTTVYSVKPGMIRTAPTGYTPLQVEYQPQTRDNANLVTNMF
ncbi:uncharacterized protein LOC124140322 isoform X2 [Haliotis rufescens]|uniref:uncharacterized protein LOC124140322 isoform X2 n=1 Tax=Haliotis rufescens TaxID=6454 RepID=UPI00201F6971|nr:uncharacterized protein LOC124140322 isoform X2 [Haliotis rufescens]